MKTHPQIAPFVFLSRIFIKKWPRGCYNEAHKKILDLMVLCSRLGLLPMQGARAKQNSKTGIGRGLIWKTRLETFILNMRCAILESSTLCGKLPSQKLAKPLIKLACFRKFTRQNFAKHFSWILLLKLCRPREITTCKVLGWCCVYRSADNGVITFSLKTKRFKTILLKYISKLSTRWYFVNESKIVQKSQIFLANFHNCLKS